MLCFSHKLFLCVHRTCEGGKVLPKNLLFGPKKGRKSTALHTHTLWSSCSHFFAAFHSSVLKPSEVVFLSSSCSPQAKNSGPFPECKLGNVEKLLSLLVSPAQHIPSTKGEQVRWRWADSELKSSSIKQAVTNLLTWSFSQLVAYSLHSWLAKKYWPALVLHCHPVPPSYTPTPMCNHLTSAGCCCQWGTRSMSNLLWAHRCHREGRELCPTWASTCHSSKLKTQREQRDACAHPAVCVAPKSNATHHTPTLLIARAQLAGPVYFTCLLE